MHTEYGGYLPLETEGGREHFFNADEKDILRTNSAKAALHWAIILRGIKKLYTPFYMCRSVTDLLKSEGIDLSFYWLQGNLMPDLDRVEEDAWVLLVNYFGIMEGNVEDMAKKISPCHH